MGNIWAGLYNTKNHLTTVADVAIATRTSANIISFFTTLNIITPASPGWALFCLALASCLYFLFLFQRNICPPLNDGTASSLHILETLMKFEIRKTQNRDTFYEQSAGSSVWFGSYSAATGRQQRLCFCVCWMNNITTQTTTQYNTNIWWELSWMDFFACMMSFF